MGLFYTSITMKGPNQEQLLRYFAARGRSALISVTIDGITTIFDKEFSRGNVVPTRFEHPMLYHRGDTGWEPLVSDLSRHFHCTTLAVEIYDDDILYYQLYADGQLIDEYCSEPDYFGAFSGKNIARFGAPTDLMLLFHSHHAERLSAAFDCPTMSNAIEPIISGQDREGQAQDRHGAVMQVLGLPSFTRYMGYHAAEANREAKFGQETGDGFVQSLPRTYPNSVAQQSQ